MQYILDSFINLRIGDIIDVLIVAFLLYKFVIYVKETRAMQLLKGVIIILLIWVFSEYMKLFMVNFLIEKLVTLGIISIVILFQPELRYALEKLGRGNMLVGSFTNENQAEIEDMISELISAVEYFSKTKTGALIAIERETALGDIIRTGEIIDSTVSDSLIKNIFFKNAPLHDGAVVIRGNKIIAASCLLPLSSKYNISKDLGTRHRAALGLAEQSDAFIIVVSEETGVISVAIENKLSRYIDKAGLSSLMRSKFVGEVKQSAIRSFFGGKKVEKKN